MVKYFKAPDKPRFHDNLLWKVFDRDHCSFVSINQPTEVMLYDNRTNFKKDAPFLYYKTIYDKLKDCGWIEISEEEYVLLCIMHKIKDCSLEELKNV